MSTDESDCGRDECGCSSGESNDEESFHPMGAEWEGDMEEMLAETEYDTELGMEMAEDAMRLVAGEISEEEFHEQYHEAVVEEFDVDKRPTAAALEDADGDDDGQGGLIQTLVGGDVDDGEGFVAKLSEVDSETDQTRRDTMKKMGAGAAALGLGGMASKQAGQEEPAPAAAAQNQEQEGEDPQMGMVIDLERCDGCLQCVTACMEENHTSTGATWMYVLTYEDERTNTENFLVRPCQHCSNAPCEKVCPVEARHTRDKDGIVLTNYETCIGCRYCQVACPYGVNYFQWGEPDTAYDELQKTDTDYDELKEMSYEDRQNELIESNDHVHDDRGQWNDSRPPQGVMGKCTFCPTRQDGHSGEDFVGTVACADACDAAGMSAIHYGDMNDPESRPQRYINQRVDEDLADNTDVEIDEEWGDTITGWRKLSAFKLLEHLGTDPNVVYLGNEPGTHTKQVEGPVRYSDIGVTDPRKEHLDQFTAGAGGD